MEKRKEVSNLSPEREQQSKKHKTSEQERTEKGKEIAKPSPEKLKVSKLDRAIMLEIKNQEDKIIPLSPTYTYDVDGFLYHQDRSMAGVFFFNSDNIVSFNYLRPYPYLNLPPPSFFSIPAPFTICSSSSGLLLCHDLPTNSYHVFNPFIHSPDSYRQIPAPFRAHKPGTPAVLIVDVRDPKAHVFHIVCAVQEGAGRYTFDTYSSNNNEWTDAADGITIGTGCHIITSSGVSNGEGMAFWLTNVPHQVVKYTMGEGGFKFPERIALPDRLNPWANLQLGRFEDEGIGLVSSSRADVRLHRLRWNADIDRYYWLEISGSLNVRREGDVVAAGGGGDGGGLKVVCRPPMEKPEPMRFEKEVPLFTGERVVVWELNWEHQSQMKARLHEMPTWTGMPPHVGESIPYVTSRLVAGEFREVKKRTDKGKEISNLSRRRGQQSDNLKISKLDRAIMLEIKNQEDNIIRLSPTYTYDVDGCLYHEDRSMAGVFFFSFDGNPSFNYLRPYPYLGLPPPAFFSIPDPFTFCSSSSGLLLCRDFPTNTYHVFNPFVGTPNSYRHIPAPTRAHQPDTPAILIVDVRQPANPVFHIICAVHEGAGEYTIDTYSSDEGNWSDAVDEVILEDNCRIIASSGVSNGQGMAFWLTSSPHQVVTYTMADGGHSFAELLEVPQGPDPWPTLQLGRLHNAGIGLVVACGANVRLFIHRVGIWCSYGYLNVRRENEEAAGGMEVVCRPPMLMPELLRFEKEVPLFAGERMVVWELIEQGSELRTRLHEMPTWTTIPPNIGDTVPYVTSGLVAAEFR